MNSIKMWIKKRDSVAADRVYTMLFALMHMEIRFPKFLSSVVDLISIVIARVVSELLRVFFYTPRFIARCDHVGKRFYLYGGIPYTCGPLLMKFGERCRISGVTTISGRSAGTINQKGNIDRDTTSTGRESVIPVLQVGSNVDIGWQSTLAIGTRITIGNNVRIASRAFLAGYPGHPINSIDRALGLADTEDQIGDIVLEDNVWLGTNVTVIAGVTVGENTIVATGSVVTTDLPKNVMAAGIPAKVIKSLNQR